MGTKPGVGEDSVILDLPSEAGTAVETDQMLSALAPSSRDLVERVPMPGRSVPTAAVGRSAKTRVAGVPVLEAHGTSVKTPFLPAGGPSTAKRIAAFGASLGLSFMVGLPVVLKADGLMGPSPATTAAQPVQNTTTVVAPPQTAAVPPPQASVAPPATVAITPPPAIPATTKGPKSTGGTAKTAEPTTPTPATAPVAVTAPPPTTPQAPAPSSTLSHGALIQ